MTIESRIRQIDEEMKQKLKELHEYMLQQGLKDSIETFQNCFDENGDPKPLPGAKIGQ